DLVVADRRRPCAPPFDAARGQGPLEPRGGPGDPVAEGAGAPALLPSAAERGQRLGRHHAALRLRALHERAVVSGESAVRPPAARRDALPLQPSAASLRPRSALVPAQPPAGPLRAA